jgi:hypothetical protein
MVISSASTQTQSALAARLKWQMVKRSHMSR